MNIDITLVGKVVEDYTNKSILVYDKQGCVIWQNEYVHESTFNRVFRDLNKKLIAELDRREKEFIGVAS